jgi:hypothetical protein
MAVNILNLPIETLQGIGNVCIFQLKTFGSVFNLTDNRSQLLPQDLKTIRLVCSRFNFAVEPQVLATLVIRLDHNPKASLSLLKALATQMSESKRVVQFARTLEICYLSLAPLNTPPPNFHWYDENRNSYMNRFLASATSPLMILRC